MDTSNGNSLNQHLEGFILSVRKLEETLATEKKKNQKIAQDYLATRTILENAARELQGRITERDKRILERDQKIAAISRAYRTLQAATASANADAIAVEEREKKLLDELNQFKAAWGEVLARENQARELILEHEKAKRLLAEQRIRLHGLETSLNEANLAVGTHSRNGEVYRRELQATTMRLQAAESQINQIRKDATTENERIRTQAEGFIQEERRTARAAAQELERIQSKMLAISEMNSRLHAEMKSAALARSEETARTASESAQLEVTQRELAMHRMEARGLETKLEMARKDASKAALMAALRHEQEVARLQKKIEHLMDSGIHAEKIDEIPDGERVYSAIPITVARSNLRGKGSDTGHNSIENSL